MARNIGQETLNTFAFDREDGSVILREQDDDTKKSINNWYQTSTYRKKEPRYDTSQNMF